MSDIVFKLVDGGVSGNAGASAPPSKPSVVPSSPPVSMPSGPPPVPATGGQAAGGLFPPSAKFAQFGSNLPPVVGGGPGATELGAMDTAMAGGEADLAALGAAAAGPIALAAMAAQKAITAAIQTAPKVVNFGLEESGKLAQNRNFEVLADVAGKAADGLKQISPVAGEAAEAALSMAKAFSNAADAWVQRGKELSMFSGDLMEANIKAQVRSFQEDIKEAQELGPAIAQLTESQSEASAELREMLLPIKKFIVEVLADIMKDVADDLQAIRAVSAAVGNVIAAGSAALSSGNVNILNFPEFVASLFQNGLKEYKRIMQELENEKNKPKDGLAVQQLWALFNQVPGAQRKPDGRALDLLNRLGDPVLAGDKGDFGGAGGDF